MLKPEEIAAFIYKTHIINGASDNDLFDIADRLQEISIKAGETILAMGEEAQSFYFIYAGKVEISREEEGQRVEFFSSGDFFGIDSVFPEEPRGTSVIAKENTTLFALSKSSMEDIPDALNFLKGRLDDYIAGREMVKEVPIDWLGEGEAVHFFVRKHQILFWRRLFLPVFLILFGAFTTLFAMWVGSGISFLIGVSSFVLGSGWLLWDWLDWRNDYYIVTDKRVIWVEKVTGIYDSRHIAHFPEIKSIDVQTDAVVQSFFDYGDVKVNTIFEGINLKYVPHPRQAHRVIDELLRRSHDHEKRMAKETLQQAIIEQIEAAKAIEAKKKAPPPAPPPPREKRKVKLFRPKKDSHLFTLRFQQGKDIIYRKHFVILIGHAIIPMLLTLVTALFFLYELYLLILIKSENALSVSFIALIGLGGFISAGWLYYQFLDWSNDIFKVSQDKIFDIDKKPLGDVQSRSASLENIESTEYKRTGLLSVFFNYGTVYINIGSEKFEFEDVFDPASVQQDINRRYMAEHEKKKAAKAKQERDQMIKWLVAYHQSADEIGRMIEEIEAVKSGNDEEG